MNDPNDSADLLLEALQNEFMELVGKGNRKAWDFALEHSDRVNFAVLGHCADLMIATGAELEKRAEGSRAPALALWALCERQSLLDTIEAEVAIRWAENELPKRITVFEEMREEREFPELA